MTRFQREVAQANSIAFHRGFLVGVAVGAALVLVPRAF